MSPYLQQLRSKIGHDLLLLPSVAAVIRDAQGLEETGLAVIPRAILGVFGGDQFRYVYPNGDAVEYTVVLYGCVVIAEVTANLDPETQSLRYFARADMPRLALPYPAEVLFSGR